MSHHASGPDFGFPGGWEIKSNASPLPPTLLAISVTTIGSHRRSLCRKLNVHSTAELVFRPCQCALHVLCDFGRKLPSTSATKGQLKYWRDCLRYATAEEKLWIEAKVARYETQLAEWETQLAASEKSEFAARLRGSRRDASLTQLQLSDKSGVSVRAIKDSESRKSTPQKKNREALAGALRIDPALF
jgi:hypothetical protein